MFYGNGIGKFSHHTQKITIKHEWFSIMKYHNFIIVIMVEIVEEKNKKDHISMAFYGKMQTDFLTQLIIINITWMVCNFFCAL